ncbi:MAG: protein kinase [Planctomycetota bacterium]|nr:protein kinase [Planctomycetota bacterium]
MNSQSTVCPNCGHDGAHQDTSLQETQLLSDSVGDAQPHREVAQRNEATDPLIGRKVHVYQCVSLIGSGGMGRVYLANHTDLERRCALKILSPKRATCDEEFVERFLQEGRSAAALVHPNVVTIHAVGRADGVHFLEMEFISGRSLQQVIKDDGRLPTDRALTLAAGVAEGLSAAHREGIIHRDVKPDNVMLTRQGIPKVSDFGLAKRVLNRNGKPVADGLCGTPNYMAPELFQGETATPASDVYALGVCLYLMLSGRLPNRAKSIAELRWKATSESVPNIREVCPDVSLEVAEALSLMTSPTPAHRPQDATSALQLIHAVLGHERDLESLLTQAFRHEPAITWQRHGTMYSVVRNLPNNRSQTVFIENSHHDIEDRLLLFYSVCCVAQPTYFEKSLRLNSEMLHGCLAIRDIDGKPYFVVLNTYPRATVDPEEIKQTVMEVARIADQVEEQLTGQDNN